MSTETKKANAGANPKANPKAKGAEKQQKSPASNGNTSKNNNNNNRNSQERKVPFNQNQNQNQNQQRSPNSRNRHQRSSSKGNGHPMNNNNNNNNGIAGGAAPSNSPNSQPQAFFAMPQGQKMSPQQYAYYQQNASIQQQQQQQQQGMSPLGLSPLQVGGAMNANMWGAQPRVVPQYYAIDVECVATGPKHNERAVAQIAVVDQWERVLLNFYVKPKEKVFSYLTDITGLDESLLAKGVDLEKGVQMVRAALPPTAILVGQNILKDVQWLGLREGIDFSGMMDLNGLWRVFNEKYKSYTYFSLHHQAKALLGISQEPPHNAATDSILSIRLFNLFQSVEQDENALAKARETLLESPIEASFAKNNPVYDGVCMGNKKTCKCGAPFFF